MRVCDRHYTLGNSAQTRLCKPRSSWGHGVVNATDLVGITTIPVHSATGPLNWKAPLLIQGRTVLDLPPPQEAHACDTDLDDLADVEFRQRSGKGVVTHSFVISLS